MSLSITITPSIVGGECVSVRVTWSGSLGTGLYIYRNSSSIAGPYSAVSGYYDDTGFTLNVSTSYYAANAYPETSNTETLTPKQLLAPSIGTSTRAGSIISTGCTANGSTCDYFNVYRSVGGSYSVLTTRTAAQNGYDDGGVASGLTATYKWGAVIAGYGEAISSASNSIYMPNVYTDTISDEMGMSESTTSVVNLRDYISDSMGMVESYLDNVIIRDTIADAMGMTDLVQSAQSLTTDFTFYLGSEAGGIYESSLNYQYDDSAVSGSSVPVAVVPSWTSKTIDFAEADLENTGRWKTLYRIEYMYRDWGAIPVTFSVSDDGGSTWTVQTKTIGGYGDGRTEHAHFHFIKTGQFFVFKIEWPSAASDFQFLGFDAIYQEAAEQFEMT